MDYTVKHGPPHEQRTGCVVVGVHDKRRLSPAAKALDAASDGFIDTIVRRGELDGKPHHTALLQQVPGVAAERVLLVHCGPAGGLDDSAWRKTVAAAAQALSECGARDAISYLPELPVRKRDTGWRIEQLIETTEQVLYRFDTMKSSPARPPALRRLHLAVAERAELASARRALAVGEAVAGGIRLARDLGNMPGNVCTPTWLAEQAHQLDQAFSDLHTRILEEKDMEALGMGALLAVSRGSREPAKLIVMEYRGGTPGDRPWVLVGKGLTFDSGGISLKPGAGMDEMKFDMCGAASVFGAMHAAASLGLPINITAIVPSSENMPDGQAVKPGDIVTSMSGQTVEILNTDAEGRLILCDALTYSERFKPRFIVDVATLTGACIIALGAHASGLYGNHPPLVRALLSAGDYSGDRAWQMPLWEDYQEQLESNFADVANIGGQPAGSITAACFLARFTRRQRWAHLDIAGTAWHSGKQKGATGRPAALLSHWLINQAASTGGPRA